MLVGGGNWVLVGEYLFERVFMLEESYPVILRALCPWEDVQVLHATLAGKLW